MKQLPVVGIVLAVLALGCNEQRTTLAPGQSFTTRGELVAGVECPMIVTSDGHRYSIAGDLGRFAAGDQVCVRGTIAEVSFCMAGEATIALEQIAPADSCP